MGDTRSNHNDPTHYASKYVWHLVVTVVVAVRRRNVGAVKGIVREVSVACVRDCLGIHAFQSIMENEVCLHSSLLCEDSCKSAKLIHPVITLLAVISFQLAILHVTDCLLSHVRAFRRGQRHTELLRPCPCSWSWCQSRARARRSLRTCPVSCCTIRIEHFHVTSIEHFHITFILSGSHCRLHTLTARKMGSSRGRLRRSRHRCRWGHQNRRS